MKSVQIIDSYKIKIAQQWTEIGVYNVYRGYCICILHLAARGRISVIRLSLSFTPTDCMSVSALLFISTRAARYINQYINRDILLQGRYKISNNVKANSNKKAYSKCGAEINSRGFFNVRTRQDCVIFNIIYDQLLPFPVFLPKRAR